MLDNFEQVIGAAVQIADLLVTCPRLQVLVTSRAVLHVRGEYRYTVPALVLPDLTRLPAASDLLGYPAVTLFAERAEAAAPGFRLTETNAAAVAAICTRLDGLPLAIELIAARTRLLSPQLLLARLGGPELLGTTGPRDLPARHQTLFAAMDSSYGLLDGPEQILFARLAAFVGGCSLNAAQAVCNGPEELDIAVETGLMSLLDKSLLLLEPPTNEEETRVTMLETIRWYAQAHLVAGGEESRVRHRHAAYFADFVQEADLELRGPRQEHWLDRLESEQGNIRAALRWSLDNGETDLAARLGGTLWRFWQMHGHLGEGRRWLTFDPRAADARRYTAREGTQCRRRLGTQSGRARGRACLLHRESRAIPRDGRQSRHRQRGQQSGSAADRPK
ncbi:MAG: ATP-binding protein [Chloroflexia bacterium]